MTHVVVLGCGVAGMLAAAALRTHAEQITLIERDQMPDGPRVRKGVPQGRHLHGLLSTGALAIDTLLPGSLTSLFDHGAHRINLPEQTLIYGLHGWMHRFPTQHFILGASRPLVEWTIRTHLLRQQPIQLLQNVDVIGLLGTPSRVHGVRTRHRGTGQRDQVTADLVVDATGRNSKTPRWLTDLGLPTVNSVVVDSGLAYASCVVRAPASASAPPCVTVQPDPRNNAPGRGGFLLLIEDNQWMVTLSGTRGAHPPLDEAEFARFALNLPHPLIGELLAGTTPLTRISGFRDTANRRHHYHRLPSWPAGFVVIGDANTTFNPIYGQGMSVAALSALALRKALRRNDLDPAGSKRVQRAISRAADLPWTVCTTEDIRYPGAEGPVPSPGMRVAHRCVDRLRSTASDRSAAAQAFFDVLSLAIPVSRAARPAALWATLRGPQHPPLREPPLQHSTQAQRSSFWHPESTEETA